MVLAMTYVIPCLFFEFKLFIVLRFEISILVQNFPRANIAVIPLLWMVSIRSGHGYEDGNLSWLWRNLSSSGNGQLSSKSGICIYSAMRYRGKDAPPTLLMFLHLSETAVFVTFRCTSCGGLQDFNRYRLVRRQQHGEDMCIYNSHECAL